MPLTLVTICLSDSRRGERRFDLIIPAAIWLSRLQSADTTGVLVPWEQWGEESRMLDSTEASCSQVFGTRYLTSEPYMSRESRYGVRSRTDLLCVYDFAPVPVLMHDLLTVGEDADVCVLTFLCSDKSVWAKPVRTAAPFKRIEVPGLVVGDSDSVYMGEDGLFVRSADYILEE
ncbi:uncharacterized protein PHACADRAFT_259297 [Phanerochaete carnosa HHB-10118-sp]|uniref:Uncharacterized protein n=1 Tax=Phanerochaete carnosa (strain HHB-10118-sp) TaxID=650164 RepID=K5WRV0_PHACS|nr:uncharacterized protein PHACADRAFT_259297 [Phanerochaete carnosa HHB-10118-sp]EKM53122.1 hypothetical protein PHACADRAFT_259297 [Phanerochaete carnosa HHB-10118-sp]